MRLVAEGQVFDVHRELICEHSELIAEWWENSNKV